MAQARTDRARGLALLALTRKRALRLAAELSSVARQQSAGMQALDGGAARTPARRSQVPTGAPWGSRTGLAGGPECPRRGLNQTKPNQPIDGEWNQFHFAIRLNRLLGQPGVMSETKADITNLNEPVNNVSQIW